MRFGPVSLDEAEGAVLAHSCMAGGRKIPKGTVLCAEDLESMRAEGIERVAVARLGAGDCGENFAAEALAQALVPDPAGAGLELTTAFTGRVNLKAVGPGIVALDAAAIAAVNRVDPAITLATLAPFARVAAGTLVGTVKIITYGVARAALDRAIVLAAAAPAVQVRPVVLRSAGLVLSEVANQPAKLSDKAAAVTGARLRALGMELADVVRVPHETAAMTAALQSVRGDIALLLTGSATSDPHDLGPEAVRAAGGVVERFGMPVDPGNLLFTARIGARPVIGLPGCARSPALNGFDWVLERIACGLEVSDGDIAAMGVGGLLKEIPTRPQPRERGRRSAPTD